MSSRCSQDSARYLCILTPSFGHYWRLNGRICPSRPPPLFANTNEQSGLFSTLSLWCLNSGLSALYCPASTLIKLILNNRNWGVYWNSVRDHSRATGFKSRRGHFYCPQNCRSWRVIAESFFHFYLRPLDLHLFRCANNTQTDGLMETVSQKTASHIDMYQIWKWKGKANPVALAGLRTLMNMYGRYMWPSPSLTQPHLDLGNPSIWWIWTDRDGPRDLRTLEKWNGNGRVKEKSAQKGDKRNSRAGKSASTYLTNAYRWIKTKQHRSGFNLQSAPESERGLKSVRFHQIPVLNAEHNKRASTDVCYIFSAILIGLDHVKRDLQLEGKGFSMAHGFLGFRFNLNFRLSMEIYYMYLSTLTFWSVCR